MAALPIQCPRCAGVSQIDSSWAGQQVACPLCGGVMVAPAEQPPISPPITNRSRPDDLLPPGVGQSRKLPPPINELSPPPPRSKALSEASQIDLLPPGMGRLHTETTKLTTDEESFAQIPKLPPAVDEETAVLSMPPPLPTPLPPLTATAPRPTFATATPAALPAAASPTLANASQIRVEPHRLSSEERAQRRLRKNVVVFALCLIILIAAFYYFSIRKL
jgi:hypothetical protein